MDPTAEELVARLRRDPEDHAAFRALGDHYRRIGDHASLANLLDGWARRHGADPDAAADALYEAACLVLELHDVPRAEALLDRALGLNPWHDDAATQRLALLEHRGDPTAELDFLHRRAAVLAEHRDGERLGRVEERIGHVYEHTLARPDRAIAHYRKAFEADPTLVPAIYAAREIYRAAGNPKAAATLFELEIKAEPSQERRVALLRELGHLRATELADLHGAIDALQRAESEAPSDLAVLHELATFLLERAGQRGDSPAAAQERDRAADLFVRLALAVPPDHAMAYCQSALDAAPGNHEALTLLEGLAAEHDREDLLPIRWVGYLQWVSAGPGVEERRRRLGLAYLEAGQDADAAVCLEPLLEQGDVAAADALVDLYRRQGRDAEATRALAVAVDGLPAEQSAPRLRELVGLLRAANATDEALARARQLLALEPDDDHTLSFVEETLRAREEHRELRDLLLEATRLPGAAPEVTRRRLREVAMLDEDHLGDAEGALAAWRAILSLDPSDDGAREHLSELLERLERWDELVALLERESVGIVDPAAKAALLHRLATIHRHRRDDPVAAMVALRNLRQIAPDDRAARDALCDLLLETEGYTEAVTLLEARIGDAQGEERQRLLDLLAATFEGPLGDLGRAFAAATRLLDEDPSNLAALDRMERIDLESGNVSRLLETLAYRAEVVPVDERPAVLVRVAEIADRELGDLERAADALQQALDLSPTDGAVLDTLCDVYDRGGRYKDLVVLLRERAKAEASEAGRAELYRRIARILGERVGNDEAAAEAWEKVLEAGDDAEALRALLSHATERADADARLSLAARLAVLVAADERRDLHHERARLAESLGRVDEAVRILRDDLLPEHPEHVPALLDLARWEDARGDAGGLADALERQLDVLEDDGLRLPVAQRLADLYEGELADAARAVEALFAWIECDPLEVEPRRRVIVHLEALDRLMELVEALDGLAGVAQDEVEVGTAVRRAAAVAAGRGDADGAWERLASRVDTDPEADAQIRALAEATGRHQALVDLFVRAAQRAPDSETQRARWLDVAGVFEGPLGDAPKALEAVLRAYALDLTDEELLGEVDRLAAATGAWPRLAQVYDTLLRSVETAKAKKKLLLRHAKLLDGIGGDASAALDLVFRACALAPDDESLLGFAEDLAPRAGRADELLVVYDRRRSAAEDDVSRADALLRAAHLCDVDLRDRERAFTYIAQVVALSVRSPELTATVERAVAELDDLRSDLGRDAARRRLVDVYRALADEAEHDPRAAAALLSRAARMLAEDLDAPEEAFACLDRASQDAPIPEILDGLEALAERLHRFDALDSRLAALIEEALDAKTAADLLRRRGRLLEQRLGRIEDAADVYRQLLTVARDDEDAADDLLNCLRRGRRHQDLLLALDREISRARDPDRRLALMRESALVWEKDLANAWEAIDAWKKVLAVAPGDPDATEAVQRLGHSTRRVGPGDLAPARPEPTEDDAPRAIEPPTVQAEVDGFLDETPLEGDAADVLTPLSGELESGAEDEFHDETAALDEGPLALADEREDSLVLPQPSPSPNPFARREGTAPLMDGFPEDVLTHVESDASLDDEFPPITSSPGGTLDDALPFASTVSAPLDEDSPESSSPWDDDSDVEEVPVRDDPPAPRFAADLSSGDLDFDEDLGTGDVLAIGTGELEAVPPPLRPVGAPAHAAALDAEELDAEELDAEELDAEELDAEELDAEELVLPPPSMPPPPPGRDR
ncbi:MAG: hypothetical protein KF901_30750 [Myxococcales bacterium]|nr:hypothetical protein [Myxococcales bacterium]